MPEPDPSGEGGENGKLEIEALRRDGSRGDAATHRLHEGMSIEHIGSTSRTSKVTVLSDIQLLILSGSDHC